MLLWLKAVRDHPDRPGPAERLVLECLVLRLVWRTGEGYASVTQLAADAGCCERTAKRALWWALEHGLAVRTKRGHALRDGSGMASEWRLCLPLEGDTGDGFQIWKVTTGRLEGDKDRLEGDTRDGPTRPTTSTPVSTARARGFHPPRARAAPGPATDGRERSPRPGAPVRGGSVEGMGTCPQCRRITEVMDGGRARPHNARDGQACPGSGEPADTTVPPGGWNLALDIQAETDEARAWLDARTGEDR
jgi:hypothetical protein